MINKLKNILRHVWLDASDTERAIPPDMLHRLTQRVTASEQRHSGEIRVYVEASLPTSYLWQLGQQHTMQSLMRQRAVAVFGKLRVWDTAHNNGVLIYVLLAEQAIEIVADRGLNQHVDQRQWQDMVANMGQAFKEKRYEDGLTQALEETSAVLMTHFAVSNDASGRSAPNRNELPDTPVLQ